MSKCRCGKEWHGKAEAHCTGCHEHFKSVFAFGKHRIGKENGRRCMTIEEMLEAKMAYLPEKGCWVSGLHPTMPFFTRTVSAESQNGIKYEERAISDRKGRKSLTCKGRG